MLVLFGEVTVTMYSLLGEEIKYSPLFGEETMYSRLGEEIMYSLFGEEIM